MKHSFFTTLFFIFISTFSYAQCGFLDTCPNTDYFNFGMRSTTDATTLEYDNFVSSFHSTLVRTSTGVYKVWGENMANNGTDNLLSPIEMTSANFPALTGTILKAGLGSNSANSVQGIVLATDGLYSWSEEGQVLHMNLTTNNTFQKLTIDGNSQGLPSGVIPTDVKMMFVTNQTVAIVTCSGNVWVLSQIAENTGTGLTGTQTSANAVKWHRVTEATSGNPFLTNVIAVRGQLNTLFALKADGTLWTWGIETYLGNNTNETSRSRATKMTLPTANPIKMIGATREEGASEPLSYYVLNANGNLYSLGGNIEGQLGDWTTTERKSWTQPRYASATGPVMNDIHWISPNEHDRNYAAIGVLTSASKLYNWGNASYEMLGRGGTGNFDPGNPNGILSTDVILAVETGGHTTMVSKQCFDKFGYVGHKIRGSMGDGIDYGTGGQETSFTFNTAVVYVCGASTLDVQLTGSIITGTNGKYCNSTSATLIPSPVGGTLTLVSGPATLSGDVLTFTGTGNQTVVVKYTYEDLTCGVPKSIELSLATEDCVLPTITTSGILTALSACSGSVSSEQSFTVSGADLTSNIVVTAPTGYQVSSTSGSSFGSTVTIPFGTGTVASTTIYVRLATTAINGAAGNITLTSTRAVTKNIATVAAVVSPLPVIAAKTATICSASAFTVTPVDGTGTDVVPSGTFYTWTVVDNANVTGESNSASQLLTPPPHNTKSWSSEVNVLEQSFNVASNTTIDRISVNIYLPSGTYNLNLYDASNTLIRTSTGSSGVFPISDLTLLANQTYKFVVTSSTGALLRLYLSHNSAGFPSPFVLKVGTAPTITTSVVDYGLRTVAGGTSISQTLTNTSTTNQNVVYTVTPKSVNCTGTPFNVTVTVTPTSVAGTITGNTPVCTGTNSTLLTLGGNTGTIQWQSSTDNITFTNIVGETGTTYTATNLAATTYYRAVVTSGACAPATTPVVTMVINPTTVAGTITGAATVCSGTNSTALTLVGNTGTIQWQSSTDNSTFTDISGETGQTYTATNLAATTYYKAVVKSGACASATTAVAATITVTPTPVVADKTATICSASAFTVTPTNGTDVVPTGTLYKWTVADNANVTGESAVSTTQSQISQTLTNTSTTNQDVVYTVTPINPGTGTVYSIGSTFNGGKIAYIFQPGDNGYAPGKVLIVKPQYLTGGDALCSGFFTMQSQTATTSTNIGEGLNNTNNLYNAGHTITTQAIGRAYAYTDGTYSDWFIPSKDELNAVFTNVSSSFTSNGFRIRTSSEVPTNLGFAYSYRIGAGFEDQGDGGCANVVVTRYDTLPNPPCDGATFTVTVTVNPTTVAGTITGAATVCSGTNSTVLTLGGNTGSVVKWQSATASDFSGTITDISSTSTTYTATALTATTYYRAVVKSGACASANTAVVTVTVNPTPVIAAKTATICSGSEFSVTPTNGTDVVPAETAYTWTVADNANVTGESNSVSQNLGGPYGNRNDVETGNIRVIEQSFNVVSNTSVESIYAVIRPEGVASNLSLYDSSNNLIRTATNILNGTFPLSNLTLLANQTYKFIITRSTNFTTFLAVNFPSFPPPFVLTVGYDSPITDKAILYSIQTVAGGTSISQTLTNTSNTNQNVVYTVTPKSGTCTGTPFTVTVTVNPTTVAGTISGATTVCSGTNSTVLTLSGNTGTIQWQSSTDNSAFTDIVGETGTTYTATNLTATTYYKAVVQSGTCASATTPVVTMTVNPLPVAVIYGVSTLCDGKTIVLSAADSAQNINYTSVLSPEVITQAASGWQSFTSGVTGNLSKVSFGFKNTNTPANTASFIAKLNIYSGAGNTSANLLTSQYVTINQPISGFVSQDFILQSPVALTAASTYTAELVALSPADKISFLNSNAGVNSAGGNSNVNSSSDYYFTNEVIPSTTGLTYQWQVNTGSGYVNVATNGTNQIIAPTVGGDYKVIITNTATTCSNTSAAKTVTVTPSPTSAAGSNATICKGETYTTSGVAANGAVGWVTTGTGTFSDPTITNTIYTPSQADIDAGSVFLTMVVYGTGSCSSEFVFSSIELTISTVVSATANAGPATASICSDSVYSITGTSTNGTRLWTTSGSGSFSDDTIDSPIYTPSATDITAGTVTLTLTVTSPGIGSCAANAPATDNVVLSIATPPTADAGPTSGIICEGSNYTLAGIATHGSIAWTTSGTGTFSNATIATPIYTPSATDLTNGSVTLTITVTGTGGCSLITDTIQLSFLPAPVADAGLATDSICSDATYTTIATATVGATILWSTSGTGTFTDGNSLDAIYTPSAADITAGSVVLTMSVTGTDVCAGVTVTDSLTLTISPAPTSNAGPATDSICVGSTYTPVATASNGAILWTTTGTGTFSDATVAAPVYTPSSTDITSGTVSLTMTVSGSGTCASSTVSDTVILTITTQPTANAGPATAHICAGSTYTLNGTSSNGAILWTTSGTGSFNSTTSNTPVYTPTAADITAGSVTLTMTVTGTGGCSSATAVDSVILTLFKVANVTSQVNVSCNGGNNGTASVTASGGTAPYTYSWSPSGGTLYSATNLTAGTYTCLVTDANGCSATSSFTITQPVVLAATTTQVNASTFAGTDGSSAVTVSGGTAPYIYSWSPVGGSAATASNLSAGTYSCIIIDANGCSVTKTVTITQPSAFLATTSQVNILCNGLATGSATVSVSGGASPITYSWSPSGGTSATASNLVAGTYTCTITDGNNVSLVKTFTITQPAILTATTSQTNVAINGNATGSASVIVSGGNSPYTYLWSPSVGTTATVNNIVAGLYSCTATDANGCTVIKTITITQPTVLASTGSQTNVNCNGATTGSATMSITGGVIPYAYSWIPSVSSGATANNLAAGTYSCTATDANEAIQTRTFTITQPTLLTATTSQTNVGCNGASTGAASVTVSGGTTGYAYSWSPSGGTAATASNLVAGSYTCTITDTSGCTLTKSFTITQPSVLTATTSQTNVAVFGATTGTASVVVSGGVLSYTYAWSPSGGTGATASNLATGAYTCTITDANGCTLTKSFTITQPSSLLATTSQTNILCNGAATGAASVSVSGGSLSYTYLWSPSGGTLASASNLVAGVYTCSITDTNGAILVKTFTITQPSDLTATITQTNVAINGWNTGLASVTVTGGTTGYSYSWTNSLSTSSTASGLVAGTYICTISDANSCSIIKTFVITEPNALVPTPSQTEVICNGASTGVATIAASGGVLPYTYSWSPSLGTGASLTGLVAGIYTCTLTDANGAVVITTFTITQPTALTATTSQTNASCNGGTNATASVVVSGGTSAYTYLWSPTGGTAATASGLTAGAYTCTVTDANGCSIQKAFTVTQPTALTAATTQTNVAINGASTGAATVVASGGTASYTYAWSPSGGTAATATNLASGTYTCTITDANGCTVTKTFTITEPTALTATTSQVNVVCNGFATGSATVSVSGAVSPYTYSWSPSGGTGATASNLAAGVYVGTITDANGAVITKTVTITQASALTATTSQTNMSCNAGVNGSASVVVSGGNSPYTYSWSPSGGLAASVNNLAVGTYTCTITDVNGCTLTKTVTITEPTALVATTTQTNVSCNGGTSGIASVSVSGGTSGYTYLWSPSGGTAVTASNLVAGSYTCTITDANGCYLSKTFTITQPTLLTATTSQTNVGCYGASTGAASVTVSGGTTGYAYSWSPSGGTAATASNLVAGSYTCTITDASGCTLTKSFTITQPSAITATTSQTNVAVFGATTGTASVVVSGGVLSYTYAWSPSGGTGATASNLATGAYTCTITDANGCTLTKSFTITQPSSLLATTSQTNILCNGAATGAASVSVSGGSLTYSYLWSPSGGTLSSASNLVAGVYTCSITDTNGAILVKTFTITQPTLLSAAVSQTNVAINGGTTGVASVTVTGGTSSYTYAWLPSGGTGATASNLVVGTYTCSIADANGCSITKTFTITEPTALAATTSQTNVLCNGATTGAASVSVTGGIWPYSYSWSPSVGTGASLNGLVAGTYVCTVTDANGAIVIKTFTITQPTALTATTSQTNASCNGGTNATATVTVSGGTATYTYLWSPTGGTAATATGLIAGAYTCTVIDTNGCSIQKSFTVTQPTTLTAATTQTNVAINGGTSGVATVVVSGGTASYTYAWSPSGGVGATATNLASGTYTCTITDANGCTVTKTFTITEPTALAATTSQTNVLCNGATTGSASVFASGAVSPYTYSWSPSGGTGATASNLAAGVYVGTITDANGAVITKTVTITQGAVIPLPIANAGPAADSICSGSTFTAAGTASNGTVLWTTSGSGTFNNASLANAVYTPSAADSATGSIVLTMTVTAPGACNIPTASDTLALTIFPTSNAGIIAGAATVCQGTNSSALTLSEYTGTIQWQVSTDNIVFNNIALATSPVFTATNLVATTYYRAVVTSGVCSSATTATATIAVNTSSVAGTISGSTPVCYGTNSTTLTLSGNLGNIQWQSSTDNSTFTAISSATSNVYTASNLTITTYFRAVSTSGVCSAATTATTVIVNPLPISNAGPASATICAGTTYTTSGIATNGTVLWSTSGTGTFANASNAVTIYTPSSADQINGSVVLTMTVTGNANGCTSNTTTDAIVLAINSPSAPVAVANQNYCYLINPTVANLTVTSGTNVNWYSAATGGTALNTTSPLATATTYYATQTVSGCESITRTAVLVTLTCSVNAVVDTFNSINGYTGGTTASVLNNDLMNGTPLVSSNVILTGITVPTGFTFNANGTITVPPSTPAGNYLVTYSICEVLNPLNCSQAVATVVVAPAVIDAVIDNYGPMNGFQGSTTTAVLENDLLNGVLVSQSEITLTVVSIPTGLVMNPNGTITVLPGTAPGIYVVNYLISENLNPTNTDQVSAIVTVVDCLTFPSNDCDGDGVTNAQELLDGTNPSDSCSMNFANQTLITTAIWNNLDCDGDGVINSRELLDGTNPTDLCSFVLTNQTLSTNANWNNSDCDGDGVRNGQEMLDGTNPSLPCSFNPIHIASVTSTAWNNSDCDGDGVTNGQEMVDGTNPVDLCSLIPTHITATTSTVWNNSDCDGDGVTNGQELLDGTNPIDLCSFNLANQTATTSVAWNNSDCDGDGVKNGREILDGTNPLDLCSLNPAHQTATTSTIWNNSDCDGDGVSNNQETVDRTDLLDPCSLIVAHQNLTPSTAWLTSDCDGDGVANGQEIIDGTDVNVACDSNPNHVTLELSQSFLDGDCDNDGLLNGEEIGANPSNPNDFDNNNIPDYLELNNHATSEDDLEIYNVVTPNGNGDNDVFVIRNIQLYPNNTVTIFNRWGIIVYDVDSYGQDNKLFKGLSEGRSTMRKLEELPIGTYFYSIRYVNSQGVQKERSGYLYLNK